MDGRVVSSLDASTVLANLPVVMTEFVFVSTERQKEAAAFERDAMALFSG
jgi:hypothetical protein